MIENTGGAVADALGWMQAVLLGSVATSLAVICVASIGLLMLSGRVRWRAGLQVIAGCFIVFGAPGIAGGLMSALGPVSSATPNDAPLAAAMPVRPAPSQYQATDPYAGAVTPTR
jgi:type IV secretory pathway VirB2 component (pilin)